jgi:hypothetical protein
MPFIRSPFTVVSWISGVILSTAALSTAQGGETHALVIAANDGYGVQDCLAEVGECGQIVADAWCEAHGHGVAVSFGPASRFAGVVATKIAATEENYVVNCAD